MQGREICNPVRSKTISKAAAAILAVAFATTGCTGSGKSAPTPANFTEALNNYFLDHPDCLLPNTRFPFETSDPVTTKQMDTLVKALLLDKSVETSIHASRYLPTTAGTRYAPRFCYGHREITSIDSNTPLTVVNGFKQTTVTYHYEMKEVPVWAKSDDVQEAFPDMAHNTSGQATGKATLAQTTASWQVPD